MTDGRNHVGYTYNSANTFAAYEVRSTDSQRHGVAFNVPGAAGLGNVTVTNAGGTQSAVLILGADDVFDESCVLTLNGQGWGDSTGGFGPYASGAWVGTSMRIFMSTFNATVSELWINGNQRAAGDYTGTSGDWIGGTGTLTVLTGPGDGPFGIWSGGLPADGDANGDGVTNAIAWVLGAADPNTNALGLLPTLNNTSDAEYVLFTFNRLGEANADPATTIAVEFSTDLVTWTTAVDDGDNVIIDVTAASPSDTVVVKLKRSALAAGGKLFARLNVVVAD